MRLISLEIHGFKSFADPQKLGFPGGMTAVVGPNGCGKSNISDALAWVLGEQRATLLRGSEMADVIFAGTSERRPMGLAEVKLALEMPDPALPGAIREVVVSRRLYRDTGSEYRINGRECRLKDVQDLLLDTGMGTRAYSFIQQGQIDLILSSKPKDRRQLLEEGRGHHPLQAAPHRGRTAAGGDAGQPAAPGRHPLRAWQAAGLAQAPGRQGAARPWSWTWPSRPPSASCSRGKAEELQGAKERILEQLDALERQIAALTAQASEKASEVERQRLALDELNRAQEQRSRAVLALEQRLGLIEQDRGFQQERIEESQAQQVQLRGRMAELQDRSGDSATELQRMQEALARAQSALEARESLVAEHEEAVALAGGSLRHVEAELKELRARRAEAEKASLALHRRRQAVHQQIAQLEGRLDALNHEEALRAPRLEGLQADGQRLDRELSASEDRLEQMEEAVLVQSRLQAEAAQASRACTDVLREAEGALETEERRIRQLSDLLKQASGSEELQKAMAWLKARGERPDAFADALEADEEILADLERLLGSWIQAVVLSQGALASLGEAPGQLWAALDAEAAGADCPEGCEPLAAHLRWRFSARRPLASLLARCFRCADADLPRLAAACPGLALVSPRLVKLPYGPVQTGVAAPSASPLKLRSELEAARKAREAHLDRVEALEAEAGALKTRLQEAGERFREMEEDRLMARRSREDLRGRLASVQAQLREIQEAQERADGQWEQLEQEIATLRAGLRELEAQPEQREEAGLTEAIHAAEGRQQEAQQDLEQRREALVEASRMRGSAWAERDGLQRQMQQLQRGAFDLEAERKRMEEDLLQAQERAGQAADRLQELEAEAQEKLGERRRLTDQQHETLPVLEHAAETLRVQERMGRELQQALENARQLHHETLIQGAQVQGSMEALAKEVELALSMTVPDFLASISDEEREAWSLGELVHQTKFTELQSKRMDLGSVNPLAIQELQEAEERLAFMNQQRKDVLEAIANLEATIKEINATSEERFREAFDFVNARFQEVFKEAFGGGSAHLSLQDPKDLLECGIEITAQPPGKSAKALTLLSGGEKALTAISLLFAIFHFKPSPFCVLDEVDAPLDEANVGRFAGMVQRMKTDTQFIVITHQKPTMVAADTLYGVTMEEKGISRLVSVQLREAEQLV